MIKSEQVPLSRGGSCRLVVRAYYFPKLLDKELRPLADEERADADGPLFSAYWQGRWIPYAAARLLDAFRPAGSGSAAAAAAELGRRVRGTLFFPRDMAPANSKLSLLDSPEQARERGRDSPKQAGLRTRTHAHTHKRARAHTHTHTHTMRDHNNLYTRDHNLYTQTRPLSYTAPPA